MDTQHTSKRLPRNAAHIPVPGSFSPRHTASHAEVPADGEFAQSYGTAPSQFFDLPIQSPSSYSEAEVVLDDGTLQRRTISLSTLPSWQIPGHDHHDMTDDLSPTDVSWGSRLFKPLSRDDPATEPLLRNQNPRCYTTGEEEHLAGSSSSTETDSDTPFFPTSRKPQDYTQKPKNGIKQPTSVWGRLAQYVSTLKNVIHPTPQQQMVLKCSFAYFLGSLFTFVPALNALIGNNRTSSHLVATATVFFNPAKTLGGMVEAAMYGWGYTLFALSVCLGSMVTTDYFVDRDMFVVAHAISLLVWLVGPTFIISFLKAHWNKPPVATASSLCFIIIFIIVVREGSANRGDFDTTRIEQITSAVATGTLVTVSCCILFWPVAAAKKLKKDVETTLTSYKVLLKLLTKTFLLDDDLPEFKANSTLQSAIESHRASFTALQKSLKEAKLEMWNTEIRDCADEYDDVVKCMQRLSQYIGGLRSSCGLQFEVMTNKSGMEIIPRRRKRTSRTQASDQSFVTAAAWSVRADHRRRKIEDEIRRQRICMSPPDIIQSYPRDDGSIADRRPSVTSAEPQSPVLSEDTPLDLTEGGTLIELIDTIRQPLKSLAYTCKQTITHLQTRLTTSVSSRTNKACPPYARLKDNLVKAIALFEVAQRHAVQRLHRHRARIMHAQGNLSINSYTLGDDVFLVYFFIFNLIEFARELIRLVEAMEQLSISKEKKSRIWSLFAFWSVRKRDAKDKSKSRHAGWKDTFTPNERNTINTLHTPVPKTKWRQFFLQAWRTLSLFKTQKMQYAIKASIAATLLATPAFLESTGKIFRDWRMEWALITLMVVMTPTVGGTNLVVIYRIFSTILGCVTAMLLYMMFPGNMIVLPIVTWLFCIPNFWIILNHKHGKFGQFTLLAFNLVMLNKYNDRDTNHVPVWLLSLQRCVAILVGVFIGLIATAYVWPYEARVELRKGLSDFLLRLSWVYKNLVSTYSGQQDVFNNHSISPANPANYGDSSINMSSLVYSNRQLTVQAFMEVELELHRALLGLQELLAQTPNEPRLKGAFPVSTYRDMLNSCQNIIDKFLTLRTVMMKDEWFDEVQREFILPLSHERKEMVGNVLLYFYLLASALRLKTPLPPYLPPARKAWESLLLRLRQLPVIQSPTLLDKEHVYMLYYAYVTMMEEIIRELDRLGKDMTQLFGALVPEQQWDQLFQTGDVEQLGITAAIPIDSRLLYHRRATISQ